jgi:hypothetical protein
VLRAACCVLRAALLLLLLLLLLLFRSNFLWLIACAAMAVAQLLHPWSNTQLAAFVIEPAVERHLDRQ